MTDAREWLNGRPVAAAVYDEVGDVAWAAQRTIAWDLTNAKVMREALLAVLDLHQPYDGTGTEAEPGPWCYGCDEGYRLTEWPCVTVQDVNKALGVSE